MHEHDRDDDLRALSGADPAAGSVAPESLRERVSRTPAASAPVRRRRWLAPAAAAGIVVASIGVGYVAGTGGIAFDMAATPTGLTGLTVTTGSPVDPAAPIALGTSGGVLSAQPQIGTQGSSTPWDTALPPQRFVFPTFDNAPARATVYAIDAGAQQSADDAVRIAAALGVAGDARQEDVVGRWIVGDLTAATPYVILDPGRVDYAGGIPDAVTVCEETATALHGRNVGGFGQEMIRCMAETPLPTDEQVSAAATLFLAAIGVDEADTVITVTPDELGRSTMATAALMVSGNVTDLVARVVVSAAGIMNASGPTGEVVSLGDYSIVSPADGAARLNDPAFAPSRVLSASTATPMMPDVSVSPPDVTAPPAPAAGSAVPWVIVEREIVSARLGLALIGGATGEQYLAPAYEFTADDDSVWSVIALDEDELATTPPRR